MQAEDAIGEEFHQMVKAPDMDLLMEEHVCPLLF